MSRLFKKDGTPWKYNFSKGHKGFERKKKDENSDKKTLEKYVMKRALKEKEAVINALLIKAKAGDVPAIKEVFDRSLGKAISSVELAGKNGAPINVMSFRDLTVHEDKPEVKKV